MKSSFEALTPQLVAWRRSLHRIPEVGLSLPKTAAYLERELRAMDIPFFRVGDGLVADIPMAPGGDPHRGRFAIRGDMDALPLTETASHDYVSMHPGCMHACGHDAHMTILLGVARWFRDHPHPFPVRLIFQPGEEGYFGAREMIRGGALEGVKAIIGCHVGSLFDEVATGKAGFRYGAMMAASDNFVLRFIGKGAHGASPNLGRDPVVASAHFIVGLQSLRAREVDPTHPVVITVGKVEAGTAPNIVPESVTLTGTLRTLNESDRTYLSERMEQLARGVAEAFDMRAELKWEWGYPLVRNDDSITALMESVARELLGADNVVRISRPSLGGEDMAYYLREVPGCFWTFTTNNAEKGICATHHNPGFDVDDSLLWAPVLLSVQTAIRYFATASS